MEISNGYELLKVQISKKRPNLENLNSVIFPCNGPKTATLIEIRNDYDSMPFLLLCQIITNCVLAREYGGRGGHVLYIDNEHNFTPTKLLDFLESHLCKHEPIKDKDSVLQNCLNSITVLSCYSSLEFTIALLEDIEESLLANENIALVIIDGLDAFFWEDGEDEQATSKVMHFKEHIIKLRRLCADYKINVIYTVDMNYNKDIVLYETQNSAGHTNVQIDYKLNLRSTESDKLLLNEREISFNNDFLSLLETNS